MPPRDLLGRLHDILTAAQKIQRYTEGMSFAQFAEDEKTIDATLRNLIVIGEAAANVPDGAASRFPDLPWAEMKGMRNIVIHEYFGVSLAIIWHTITDDIPDLQRALEQAIEGASK